MIRSEKKILALEIFLSIFLFISIFFKNIANDYFVIILLLITITLVYFIAGYEKDSNINGEERRKLLQYVLFYCTSFIVFEYGLGLLTGFNESPYKNDLINIILNAFPTVFIIILSEFFRYMIIKKGEKNKIILCFSILLFVLIDLTLNVKYWDLSVFSQLLEFTTSVLLTSFFKNIMLTTFTYKYGMKPSILYRLILELYIYIIPFTPSLGLYLESIFLMIFPILLSRIVSFGFDKSKKEKFSDKKHVSVVAIIIIILATFVVALNSNLFRYWMVAVGSGSMEPTINVGDLIIIDKRYQKRLDKLAVGDVLVFKIGKNIYTHRITKITNNNGKYSINTKGDRKGQMEDSWVVTNDDVIGVVKFKINYIGYPTVWLSRILEGNNG